MGNKLLNAPKIASQFSWYLERQLKNFKKGIRGADFNDKYGMQMRPMSLTLSNDQAISNIASYIASMPTKAIPITINADIAAGKKIYVLCESCHGSNGEGNKASNAPKLAGQHDWYVVRQLKNFKTGIRGIKKRDIYGAQMRPISLTLINEEALSLIHI